MSGLTKSFDEVSARGSKLSNSRSRSAGDCFCLGCEATVCPNCSGKGRLGHWPIARGEFATAGLPRLIV